MSNTAKRWSSCLGLNAPTLSVQDYKDIFDANNYKKDSYEIALFITFLMNKSKSTKEMEELTGLKKSQVFSYKKVIKHNKTEELRTTPFRNVLKSCTETKPKVEEELVQAIEKLNIEDRPRRSKYEAPHYFNQMELSPGSSTFYKNYICPCGLDTGPSEGGQNFVHIPHLEISTRTFLRLDEITDYEQRIRNLEKRERQLMKRVKELEEENGGLRAEKKFLSEALKASG